MLHLIMDSLRYWVSEMHVDGFRFDLASALARELHDVDRLSSFFDLVHQDPVVSRAKLIAEPSDLGEGGYKLGHFPVLWTEWNGRYRDEVRDFWRGRGPGLAELRCRLAGSPDLYRADGRRPYASVNFVTAHDGFTLTDLVSFERKRNEANGEDDRDGSDDNRSWNCGVEGPTDDAAVNTLRRRQRRNLLATLFLSQGAPMLLGGDELGRTQDGNNNAYCQDNDVSWYDWDLDEEQRSLLAFTRGLVGLRRRHPVLRRSRFLEGRPAADGAEIAEQAESGENGRTFAMFLNGDVIVEPGPRGERVVDDSFLVLINGEARAVGFELPDGNWATSYEVVLDTATDERDGLAVAAGLVLELEGRSVVVLRKTA